MAIRVFNADDHPMLRKGITDLIVESNDLEWVGSAENGEEALKKIRALNPDVAILDIEMPLMSGLEVAKTLSKEGVKTSFILLTLFNDPNFLKNAFSIGIKGYLLKESSGKEIIECIKAVNQGRNYVNASLTHVLFQQNKESHHVLNHLTEHEINILKLISIQKTSSEIADMLFISPKTVANHRSNISKKLHLSGEQNSLLIWAIEHKEIFT
jgi:DNA-binding NarL/FixJ family response regulator